MVSLVFAYAALIQSTWRGSTELHTITEGIAAILALIVGLVAIVRFYAKKNNTYLFVGTGFIGTALLDAYHAIVTSSFFDQLLPSGPPYLIPWSWNASRTFLALLMLLSYWAWKREQRLKAAGRIGEGAVYISVSALTLISFYFFAFVPLPRAYYPELFFGRPEEFISAALFLMALIGYLKKGTWRQDPFENALVVSLVIGFIGQALFMSRSFGLFDAMFDTAHMLKVITYAVVLVGLQVNSFHLYRQADRTATDLARVNESLEDERNLQQALIDNLPDYIYVKDVASRFVTTNAAHLKLLGAERVDDVVGKTDFDFFRRELAEQYYRDEQELLRSGSALPYKVEETEDIEGSPSWVLTTKIPLKDADGSIRRLVGLSRDVSELKQTIRELDTAKRLSEQQAAELERADGELEQFAYVASHDLQEPVRSLVSYSTLLREDLGEGLSEDAATDLDYIGKAANRMQTLITDLLAFSRAGRAAMKTEAVSLDACVDESLEALRSQLEQSGAQIERQVLPKVVGDATLLTQLYQNLLSNALKFSRSGEPVVELTARQTGDVWTLGVRDNGIGLEPDYADQIFEPFKRLHGLTEYPGTGGPRDDVANMRGKSRSELDGSPLRNQKISIVRPEVSRS